MITANKAARKLLGVNAFGDVHALEEGLAHCPRGLEALFRLTRAVDRGEAAAEDVYIADGMRTRGEPMWLRISAKPVQGHLGIDDGTGAVIWS